MEIEQDTFLLCRAGPRLCALPLGHVGETMRPLPVDALAGVPPFVAGVAVIRGAATPVVDVARLLDATGAPSSPGRFVTIRLGVRQSALAFEAVLGVRRLKASDRTLPPLLRDVGAGVVAAIGALDGDLLVVLESARAVHSAAWAAIGARTGDA